MSQPPAPATPGLSWFIRLLGTLLFIVAALDTARSISVSAPDTLFLLGMACWLGSTLV